MKSAVTATLCLTLVVGWGFNTLANVFSLPQPEATDRLVFVEPEESSIPMRRAAPTTYVDRLIARRSDDVASSNVRTYRRIIREVVNTFDVGKARQVAAPDAVFHFLERDGYTPDIDGFVKRLAEHREAFPDMKLSVLRTVASGDKVGAVSLITGTHVGDLPGMPATNKPFRTYILEIVRYENGKIVESWNYVDMATALRQVGLMPGEALPADAPIRPSPVDIGPPMTPKEAVSLHRRFFEEKLLDLGLTGPNYVRHGEVIPESASDAEYAKESMQRWFAAFPNLHFTVEDAFSDGEYSIVRWSATGTHLGDLPGIPATGKSVEAGGIAMVRVGGGKFHEHWGAWNMARVLQQLRAAQ